MGTIHRMSSEISLTAAATRALPAFNHPTLPILHQPRVAHSAPDPSQRRHSLPLHYLPPGLWSANTSSASLVESEEAARGEHILDEATVAHRISALRQLNGATRSRHRYAKSTGARNSTYNQPVIVRTYSGTPRPRSRQRDLRTTKKVNGMSTMATGSVELKLPPVEAFSFKGIMDEIKHGVAEDLERIAEICARSKYSLSNQYEVHMPPHGRGGEPVLLTVGLGVGTLASGPGPTLQAIGSDDEQPRHAARGSRATRRTKSAAYGTLETIMSSSRSSDEDKSKKKPAAVLAEEVRGRAANKEEVHNTQDHTSDKHLGPGPGPTLSKASRHVRSKSASFASMIIDNAQIVTHDAHSNMLSPTSLISEPARPQTSTATDLESVPEFDPIGDQRSPTLHSFMSTRPTMIRNESRASTLRPEMQGRPSILGTFGSWLPWSKSNPSASRTLPGRMRSASHAEGSLRELLKTADFDKKGKGIDHNG
jgi:hypothetical protein